MFIFYIVLSDVNECLMEPCKDGGKCKNTFGSFMCTCSPGYTVDETGLKCVGKANTLCLLSVPSY